MRLRVVALLGIAVLVFAACSSIVDGDETRADAGTDQLGSEQAASPTSVSNGSSNEDDSSGDGPADDPEDLEDAASTETTDVDSDGTDSIETSDATDQGQQEPEQGSDTEVADVTDGDDESADGESDTDDPDDTDEVVLTGPGSASAASAMTLVPVGQDDSGDDVLALQRRLAELGFAPGTPDGSYGRRTVAAVEAFQGLVGLQSTGEANAATITALVTYRYDGLVLHAGDEGADVETLQLRLSEGPFDPGAIDGAYGTGTVQAVWALEKLAGIPVDGDWGPLDEKAWEQLTEGDIGRPEKDHDERWVEVDLSKQIMKVYDPDSTTPTLISHASSGSGIPWKNEDHSGSSVTPLGDFEISRRISGWRESSLNIGRLYNPLYFNGGIAFHGANSVPLYPASHGCIRLPMHVADYLPGELPNGTPVHILK